MTNRCETCVHFDPNGDKFEEEMRFDGTVWRGAKPRGRREKR